MEEIYPKVKPFLQAGSCNRNSREGKWTDGELETSLIDNKICAYSIFDGKTALCGIEQAYNQETTSVSCHLYPIRKRFYWICCGVNYDKDIWDLLL
jgi:hypothetical protein